MAITANNVQQTTLSGGPTNVALSSGGQAISVNANAPPPQSYTLNPGINTLVVPSGFTINVVQLIPLGSGNVKTLKGVSGDTGFTGWTNNCITIPVAAGGTFVVVSTGSETLDGFFS